ncbi:hypothetical protein EDEG_01070 [Edhazardia aedis USNM 41457]|uniref:Dolichol-phosphate mannosyltransferase subunit 1 n=1 Tax=Edhazardia aedis (strain USNM 41457) TaxID=1003232 RepID=J9DTV3_EDHAE|nr:hypothetical protein EDEG_01070 [Edhazardia aedis USNM 41457]|eukprot:EJW04727.1 hypothetical protein EDEG_01070 [Edhazardia aedis USNM 41457]
MIDIILPTYNEKENIKPMLKMLAQVSKHLKIQFKIIIIDDNSPDKTHTEALKYKDKVHLKLIQRPRKMGLGSAYKDALLHCTSDFVLIMDVDLSHNPFDIIKMVNLQQKRDYDIVIGSRYLNTEKCGAVNWSLKRKIISRGANNLAQIMLNLKSSDVTGSFRLYKANVFRDLVKNVKSTGFSYQMEMLFLAEKIIAKSEKFLLFSVRECTGKVRWV